MYEAVVNYYDMNYLRYSRPRLVMLEEFTQNALYRCMIIEEKRYRNEYCVAYLNGGQWFVHRYTMIIEQEVL